MMMPVINDSINRGVCYRNLLEEKHKRLLIACGLTLLCSPEGVWETVFDCRTTER